MCVHYACVVSVSGSTHDGEPESNGARALSAPALRFILYTAGIAFTRVHRVVCVCAHSLVNDMCADYAKIVGREIPERIEGNSMPLPLCIVLHGRQADSLSQGMVLNCPILNETNSGTRD